MQQWVLMETVEKIKLLAGSECRIDILDLLTEHQTLKKSELRSKLDASRTTVGRNLTSLEEQGWIDATNQSYTTTRKGNEIYEKFTAVLEGIEITDNLQAFLKWIPDEALNLKLESLADAEIWLPKPGDPRAMINHHTKFLEDVDHYRVILPFTGLYSAEQVEKRLSSGTEVEAIVTPTIKEIYFTNPNYNEILHSYFESGSFEAFVSDKAVPFCLAIIDEVVHIIAAEDDEPRALLETRSPVVHDWAQQKFSEHRNNSAPVKL